MRRPLVLFACLMATFMAAVESTIVVTAMPSIATALGGFSLFSWAFSAYMLAQAISIPVYGRLADAYGRKRLFYLGAGMFLAGSVLCSVADTMLLLVLSRAIQGLGAGGVQPIANTIVGDIYTPRERAKVQGLLSSAFAVSALVGPSLGAFLVEYVHWRAVFLINIPFGITSVAMIAMLLPERIQHGSVIKVDYAGAGLLALATGGLTLLLVQGSGFGRTATFIVAMSAFVAAMLLAWHERRTAAPLLPIELWRNRVIVIGSSGSGLIGAIMMGIVAFLPTYVQAAMGFSVSTAGFFVALITIVWALSSAAAGQLLARSSYRLTATLGTLLLVFGCFTLFFTAADRGPGWAGAGVLLVGIGMGLCNTTFMVSVQAAVSWQNRGAATSSAMFLRFMGQALGAAGFGAVLNVSFVAHGVVAAHAVELLMDPSSRSHLSSESIVYLTDMIAHGMRNGYLFTGVLAVSAFVLARLLPRNLSPGDQAMRP